MSNISQMGVDITDGGDELNTSERVSHGDDATITETNPFERTYQED